MAAILGQSDTRSSERYANVNKKRIRQSLENVHRNINQKGKDTPDMKEKLIKEVSSMSDEEKSILLDILLKKKKIDE